MIRCISLSILLATPLLAGAPYPSSQLRVDLPALDTSLEHTWQGIKARNIDAYGTGLIHRPKSEMPGDAVSEGSSYGMLLALYSNDQATFNRIWEATEKSMWSEAGQCYNWRVGPDLKLQGTGLATDADQDIALALLFADSLVKKQVWKSYTTTSTKVTYKTRALALVKNLWTAAVEDGKYMAPGGGWGGKEFVNPGYFSPASYRIFAQVDPTHDWASVINQCYASILANPGAAKGLLPDWMVPDGTFFTGSLGYNPFYQGRALYKDAIRVHWRMAMDWLWFGEPRAKRFLDSAMSFIKNPDNSNFFTMDGALVPAESTFTLSGLAGPTRSRREHSHLTLGMWACAAMASKDPAVRLQWANALLATQDSPTSDYWGYATDPTGGVEDTAHNEMYFDQFLAWFGAATLAGRFSNIWADLADPNPSVKLAWATFPTISAKELDFNVANFTLSGTLSKPASWSISIASLDSASYTWSTTGLSTAVAANWNGASSTGKPFPQGWAQVTIHCGNLDDLVFNVWVGHQRDLRTADGSWLIIDEFPTSTLSPNLGAWRTFNNADKGGTASVTNFGVTGTGTEAALGYDYNLGENGYQYCGGAWDAAGWTGIAGVQKLTYRMRAKARTVVDLYFVQPDITDDNYWHVYDTIGTSWKTYTHSLSDFTGRFGSRSGSPDLSKVTAIRWHVQVGRPSGENSTLTGHLELDDFRVAGNMATMYSAPKAKIPMPYDAVGDRPARGFAVRSSIDGLSVEAGSAGTAILRDLSGRILSTTSLTKGTNRINCSSRGALLVEIVTPGHRRVEHVTRF